MASSDRRRKPNQREEADRYRKAADLAIENLDWCINYLHQIRKHKIANSLHRNRMTIVKRYRDD